MGHPVPHRLDGRTRTYPRTPSSTLGAYVGAALQTERGAALTWGDVDMKAKLITLRSTKTKSTRALPITEPLEAFHRSHPRSLNPAAPVLPRITAEELIRSFRCYVQTIGLTNLTLHDLRHDVASTLTGPRASPSGQ